MVDWILTSGDRAFLDALWSVITLPFYTLYLLFDFLFFSFKSAPILVTVIIVLFFIMLVGAFVTPQIKGKR